MKIRILACILGICFLFCIAGCGGQVEVSPDQDTAEESERVIDNSRGEATEPELSDTEQGNSQDVSEGSDSAFSTGGISSEPPGDEAPDESEGAVGEDSRPTEESTRTESSEESSFGTSSESSKPQQTGTGTHTHSYKETVINPNCTEKGYTLYKCNCGDSYRGEETDALGHQMEGTDPYHTVVATETKRGSIRYTCIRNGCSHYEDRETYTITESCELLSQRILYWINEYRTQEGAKKAVSSSKLTELSQYRAKQALQGGIHAGHNTEDGRKAAEATKCGTFYDITEVDPNTGEYITPFWEPCGQEAYCTVDHINLAYAVVGEVSYDGVAKQTVDGIRASSGHWAYVGAKDSLYSKYVYIGIGISTGGCYIIVSEYNPDEVGYERYYLNADGIPCHEWVKP